MPNLAPADYSLQDYVLNLYLSSIGGTPLSGYVVVPMGGILIVTKVTPYGAITTADCTLTVSVLPQGLVANVVTVGGTVTVPLTGAAAGTISTVRHTTNRKLWRDDVIRITPAGASGASIAAMVTFRIRR
jgi:hypothetical protein